MTWRRTASILAIEVSANILAPPPLRLQKHTDLRAHEFAHWPHLWHDHRLANCRYALSRRLCEITPTIHASPYNLDLSAIHSGVLRHLKHNVRSGLGIEKTFPVYLLLFYIIIIICVQKIFYNVIALFIFDIKDFYHAGKDFRRWYSSWIWYYCPNSWFWQFILNTVLWYNVAARALICLFN